MGAKRFRPAFRQPGVHFNVDHIRVEFRVIWRLVREAEYTLEDIGVVLDVVYPRHAP